MIAPGHIRSCTVRRDDETVIEQTYRFESSVARSSEIDQLWRSADGTGASGRSRYEIAPEGFVSLRIDARRGNFQTSVAVALEGTDLVLRSFGEARSTLSVSVLLPIERPLLLDIDDPIVDWINALVLLGLCDGDSLRRNVVRIDGTAGTFGIAEVLFRRNGRTIMIENGADPRFDRRLVLSETSFELQSAEAGGFHYEYG